MTAAALSAPPIRVFRAITRLNVGGPALHTILLTAALNDGHAFQSTLVAGTTTEHEGDMMPLARRKGVQPVFLPELGREISPADDVVALAKMLRLMRAERPDVVHTHMAKAGTVARVAARLLGVPLVIHTYHGHVFHGYFSPRKTRVFLAIERALALGTHRIVVVGERQRDEIAGFGVAPRDKLLPIRLGLDLEGFLTAEHLRGTVRRSLGIAAEVPLVGIVARLVPIKAHEDFFAAAEQVLRSVPNSIFLVVGDGERRAELEALVRRMGLEASVRFLGWRQDLAAVYADLDVVALASRNEGSPVALIEALAAARPVVSTAVGGVPEVVVDGQTGLTVPASDARALGEAVVRLLRDPQRAAAMGQAGRRHVYPRYASTRLVDDMRALYTRELAVRGRPIPTAATPFLTLSSASTAGGSADGSLSVPAAHPAPSGARPT